MTVTVKLFAAARDAVGSDSLTIQLRSGSTIRELRQRLVESYPPLAALVPHCLFAVHEEYASDETVLAVDDTLACIPPVSGG